jgi:ParB-like chromosome segregation protein Spo0J
MKKMEIVYKATTDLIPYIRNSRAHSDAQVAQIAASIREFGFRVPVLIDADNGIIAGHGRVLAALKLGMEEVPTIDGSDMTDVQRRMYVIADNKIALNATWDEEILMLEIDDLRGLGADIELIGFDEKELSALDGEQEEKDDDMSEPSDESRNLLMIECQGERELEKLFEEMKERGFECKILS